MSSILLIVTIKADFINKANQTYDNLRQYEELFEQEAYIINHVKCVLLQSKELDDFSVHGTYVSVYSNNSGYQLIFDNRIMHLEIYDKQIIDYYLT